MALRIWLLSILMASALAAAPSHKKRGRSHYSKPRRNLSHCRVEFGKRDDYIPYRHAPYSAQLSIGTGF